MGVCRRVSVAASRSGPGGPWRRVTRRETQRGVLGPARAGSTLAEGRAPGK